MPSTTRPTPTQVSESSSITVRSLLLGFAISYSTRGQSSNVRWVCCWWDVISSRRRTKRGQTVAALFNLPLGESMV